MQKKINTIAHKFLSELKKTSTYRSLKVIEPLTEIEFVFKNKKFINFSSNDYLSLSKNTKLITASVKYSKKFGTSSSSSRLITGNYSYFGELEGKLANVKGYESALIFNSGYIANLSVIQALGQFHPIFLLDRFVHASIIDAVQRTNITFKRFRHNDIDHLESLIKRYYKFELWIVVDSVYSMEGDLARLTEFVRLKKKYNNLHIYVDEAHATGIFGKTGNGLCESFSHFEIDIVMGTFSKALASFGSYVLSSQLLRNLFINNSRPFIYTTALPPSIIGSNIAALEMIEEHPNWGSKLLKKSFKFRRNLEKMGYNCLKSESQIIPVICKTNEKTILLSKFLLEKNIWASAIRTPTVPKNTSRIRFTINRLHKKIHLDKVLEALEEYKRLYEI